MATLPAAVRKRLKPDQRRAAILRVATDVLLESGIAALSLRHLARRLGVAPGLINHYFPEIEMLVAEAFTTLVAGEANPLFDAIDALPEPRAQIAMLVAALVTADRRRLSLVWLDGWQASRHPGALRQAVLGAMDLWHRRLSAVIARGRAAGVFACPAPAASATRIIALVDGLSIAAVIDDPADPARTVLGRMVIEGIERELGISLAPEPR